MCKDLEISRSVFSELKSGRTKSISAESVLKITDYFGVSFEFILYGEEGERVRECIVEASKILKTLSEREIESALAFMRALARR